MQWVILIIVLINLFLTLGLVGAAADKKPAKKTGHTFLDDDEPVFMESPIPANQRPKRKRAVKQTTTLKKKANVAKSVKRASNGRFA